MSQDLTPVTNHWMRCHIVIQYIRAFITIMGLVFLAIVVNYFYLILDIVFCHSFVLNVEALLSKR